MTAEETVALAVKCRASVPRVTGSDPADCSIIALQQRREKMAS